MSESGQDRNIVVVGGARGIGAAIVAAEVARGYRAVVGDMLPVEQVDPVLSEPLQRGQLQHLTMNVTDESSVRDFAERTVAALGLDKPLVVVKMAGISRRGDLTKPEDFEGVRLMYDINVEGDRRVAHAFADALRKTRGTAVLASSIVAESGQSTQGDQFYQMTKLLAWYRSAEILHDEQTFAGVSAWAVAPGLVVTDLTRKEVTFPATMVPVARAAARDEKLRAELAQLSAVPAGEFPGEPAQILYATHREVLQALAGHDALKKLLDKDPALGMRTAGVFLNRAARDPKTRETNPRVVARSIELLEALDIAIAPEVVAALVSDQLDAGKLPPQGILKAYSKGGDNRITRIGLS